MAKELLFDDAALRRAAEQTADAMLSALPAPEECAHGFSDIFRQKMDLLFRKDRRRMARSRVWHRVAAAILAAFLISGTWLTVDVHAREKLFQWTKEVIEDMFVYYIDGNDIEQTYCGYEPSWLPEGFTLVDSDHSDEFGFDYYYYENTETDQIIVIDIDFMKNGAMSITVQDAGEPSYHDINGVQGTLFPPDEGSEQLSLLWIDEENFTVFILEANIPEQDILHIARGIIPSNSTK